MEYDYSALTIFVYDYMTISHNCFFSIKEYYDVDDPDLEEMVISNAKDSIVKHYGINLIDLCPIDIVIEWQDYPTEEYTDPFMDENGD